ncbi:MAG: hypothetical protein ACRBB6_02990 [Neptuniibacter sp.]
MTVECVGPVTCSWMFLGDNVASIIAACAMTATFWQGYITRKHNRLSVEPYLHVKADLDCKQPEISFDIINNGVGPAFINSIKIRSNDKTLDTSNFHQTGYELSTEFKSCFKILSPGKAKKDELRVLFSVHSLEPGEPIKAGSKINLLSFCLPKVEGLKADLLTDLATRKISTLTFEIKYSSLYGKSFTYTFNQG